MAKATHVSVTEVPCTCRYLERQADDPASPITSDPRLNEYHFEYPSPCEENGDALSNSCLIIYHCPFCGGAAPKSKRDLLFAAIPRQEVRRLSKLLRAIRSLDEAIETLGPPDNDFPDGETVKQPEGEDIPPTVQSFRTLWYCHLSPTADVVLTDWLSKGVQFRLQGKYLGGPSSPDVEPGQ